MVVYDSNRTIVGLKPHRAVEQDDVNVVGVKFLAEIGQRQPLRQ